MRKIEYAVAAASVFIETLHREDFDRGMIATFGEGYRVQQNCTCKEAQLHSALGRVLNGGRDGKTRLYDSLEDAVKTFWQGARHDRPWLLTVITDGQDNASAKYRNNPAGIGEFIGANYNHEDSNFIFVIGVGNDQQIDKRGLGRMGDAGNFPAVSIEAFPLLMEIFLEIAVEVTGQLVGRRMTDGRISWGEVAEIYRISQTPLDYGFLIDVSSSMNEPGDAVTARIV